MHFSRWEEANPQAQPDAESFAHALYNGMFARFWISRLLHSVNWTAANRHSQLDTILWEILMSDRICDIKLTLMCSGYSWVQDTHGYRILMGTGYSWVQASGMSSKIPSYHYDGISLHYGHTGPRDSLHLPSVLSLHFNLNLQLTTYVNVKI